MRYINFKAVVALLAFGLFQARATNITINDYNAGNGFGGGPTGVGLEDNETEPGTIHSQVWDMEAFVIANSTTFHGGAGATSLFLVGGYDINNGVTSGGYNYKSGDLFIKLGSPAGFLPTNTSIGYANVSNGTYYAYDYAIDLSAIGMGIGLGSTTVYDLKASSLMTTVIYDQLRSNPWKYLNGSPVDGSATTGIRYTEGYANNAPALASLGLGGLLGGLHNILEIDMAFLAGTTGPVYFHYTMECGNDMIKGSYGGGFDAPDASASIILIGLGLVTVAVAGFKRRGAR